MKKKLIAILQIEIAIALFAWIFQSINRDSIFASLQAAGANWPWLILAFGLFAICIWTCSLRWQLLLHAQDIRLSLKETIRLYMIGHFFNAFALGSTGGDLGKAYYATRTAPEKKTEAATTVFLDRVVGLMALIIVMLGIMLCRLDFFLSFPETRATLWMGAALAGATVIGLLLVFGQNWMECWAPLKRLSNNSSVGLILNKIYQASRFCFSHPILMAQTLTLSILNQCAYIVIAWIMGRALAITMSLLDYASVIPVIGVITAIPLTPGGLGTREQATVTLLHVFNVAGASALTLSLLLYSVVTFWSLVGGVVYMLSGRVNGEK